MACWCSAVPGSILADTVTIAAKGVALVATVVCSRSMGGGFVMDIPILGPGWDSASSCYEYMHDGFCGNAQLLRQ